MNKLILAAGLFALAPLLSQPADAAGRGARGELVYQVVKKWGPYVQEAYRADIGTWAQQMGPTFAKAPLSALQSAADASNFDAMTSALLGAPTASKAGADISPNSLGDAATDLVFVPISPCRLFDTRLAGGAIAANTVRSFDVTAVSDYSFQGGAASNCNGVGAAGSFAAAVINFTTVTPAGAGYITAFPFGTTQPLAATVNYAGGDIRGNVATVALDQGASANELSVYTFAQTHLVGDIIGYFINPQATALECVEVESADTNINAGASANVFAPACAAGYTQVEVQCRPSTFSMRQAGSWTSHCNMINEGASAATAKAASRCCRVPGR